MANKTKTKTAERRKLVRQLQQDLRQMWIESVLLYSRVQKSPSGTGAKSLGYQLQVFSECLGRT